MSDRITYKRLVGLSEFEHLSLEVSQDVERVTGDRVQDLVEHVDAWAALAKRKALLERRLRDVEAHFQSLMQWAGDDQDEITKHVTARDLELEKVRKEAVALEGEWA